MAKSSSKPARASVRVPAKGAVIADAVSAPQRVPAAELPFLVIRGARQNNLKNLTVRIPLQRFVCVTGVSGSGKSSLVNDILWEALSRDLNEAENATPGLHDGIDGLDHLDKVIDIDQSPIGRTPRSNPATYIKLFDLIRDLYTQLPDAKLRGYKPGRFSFNVTTQEGGGRCEACEGNGANKIEMDFLADMWVTCPVCQGRRFNHETLQVHFHGKSIADVLDMDVQQALELFVNVPRIAASLQTLHDVGLDYMKLGQSSTTLSGGEAQRVKLARELVKRSTGRTLYILDEPTTGLHFEDIRKLLTVLHGFVDAGNSVIVIEHNLDVIKTADWIIDLGPEGGQAGGKIVAEGTPEEVAEVGASYTGQALGTVLNAKSGVRIAESGSLPARLQAAPSEVPHAKSERSLLSIIGARQHNLKDLTVQIPRGKMTVLCGPSGSGKTSLAMDTIYTEGQRRYVESLSSYARQFLGQLQKPKVDHIDGLSPAIAIEQKSASRSPRSTVGTVTEIYDYMRVLWARVGQAYCPDCRVPVTPHTSDEIVEQIRTRCAGQRVLLMAAARISEDESTDKALARIRASGFGRIWVDGVIYRLDEALPKFPVAARIQIVVDRVEPSKTTRGRLAEGVEQCLSVGNGLMEVVAEDEPDVDRGNGKAKSSLRRDIDVEEDDRRSRGPGQDGGDVEQNRGRQQAVVQSCLQSDPLLATASLRPHGRGNDGRNSVWRFSQKNACLQCGTEFPDLTPHHFSFNTRLGWCSRCEGLGTQRGADPAAIAVHPTRSVLDGALAGWDVTGHAPSRAILSGLLRQVGAGPTTPWLELTEGQRLSVLQGAGDDWIAIDTGKQSRSKRSVKRADPSTLHPSWGKLRFRWRGYFPAIDQATKVSWSFRARLEEMVTDVPCQACGGSRLLPMSAAVRVGERAKAGFGPGVGENGEGQTSAARSRKLKDTDRKATSDDRSEAGVTIQEVCNLPLDRALASFETLKLDARRKKIAGDLIHEITSRLRFLIDVGLDYVTLHRSAPTLSGGEAQRIQLASQIGSGLTGVLYVLDEPTIGLHPRDNSRLIGALKRLRDLGNTLLVVEHDREVIAESDHALDFGPGAGIDGGTITASGNLPSLINDPNSLTGRYLGGSAAIAVPRNRRTVDTGTLPDAGSARSRPAASGRSLYSTALEREDVEGRAAELGDDDEHDRSDSSTPNAAMPSSAPMKRPQQWLIVQGARQHNLKEIDAAFPLARFTCVSGVSGSGKSSLVGDVLHNALAARIHRARVDIGAHEAILGVDFVDKIINVDQSPIGGTPSSNPATYTGVFDLVRELFARLPDSKMRGYSAARFSFNLPGGRCEACEGNGQKRIEMHFLADVWVECEACHGTRYTEDLLEIRYRGRNISDVLNMRVREAMELFGNVPKLRRLLETLDDVGLGYLPLGQSAPTLSGGEAQRVKLAAELGRPSTGRTLYILDEPTTGLHFDDIKKLLNVLHRLVDLGNTVICVEHNLDVLKVADWIIDLGPEAGQLGGRIVVAGPPEVVAACAESHTGRALIPVLRAGPQAERPVHDPHEQVVRERELAGQLRIKEAERGGGGKLPWERDGRRWHLERHDERVGGPMTWDPQLTSWIIERCMEYGELDPPDWKHRSRVELRAGASRMPWFCHLRTAGRSVLELTLRVGRGTFRETELRKRLGIKPLDARSDLCVYGNWERVTVFPRGQFDDVQVQLLDKKDCPERVLSAFLKEAVASYFKLIAALGADRAEAEPWKAEGEKWHLSQQSIKPGDVPAWKPALLPALIGLFRKAVPGFEVDYSRKTSVQLTVPGIGRNLAIVTQQAAGLRVVIDAPRNRFTPTRVEGLGALCEIERDTPHDRLIFWVQRLEQLNATVLRDMIRVCFTPATETVETAP